MTNLHQCLLIGTFKGIWSTHLPHKGHRNHKCFLKGATLYFIGWLFLCTIRGGSRISGNGVYIYKGVCVGRFTDFISFFLNIPWKWNNLVSLRPNYFIFKAYLKNGGGGGSSKPTEPQIRHWLYVAPTGPMKMEDNSYMYTCILACTRYFGTCTIISSTSSEDSGESAQTC